jgi:hypothetical protein
MIPTDINIDKMELNYANNSPNFTFKNIFIYFRVLYILVCHVIIER